MTGYIPSGTSRYDHIYTSEGGGIGHIPTKYRLPKMLKMYDQGNIGCCVSCAVAEAYYWYTLSNGRVYDIDFTYIYSKRSQPQIDGMTPREAFAILCREGRIKAYSRITNFDWLYKAIVANGPCLIALPVYNYDTEFWQASPHTYPIGGHAVAAVGYNKQGLIIKNSWGVDWGGAGFATVPTTDFDCIMEAWTIMR